MDYKIQTNVFLQLKSLLYFFFNLTSENNKCSLHLSHVCVQMCCGNSKDIFYFHPRQTVANHCFLISQLTTRINLVFSLFRIEGFFSLRVLHFLILLPKVKLIPKHSLGTVTFSPSCCKDKFRLFLLRAKRKKYFQKSKSSFKIPFK